VKLRKLHIDNYKMFKDFDISFVDENDEALPIVVLAGVNGSGKTTLLEWIFNEYYKVLKEEEYDKYKEGLHLIRGNTIGTIHLGSVQEKNTILVNDYFTYFLSGIDNIKKVADEFIKTFYFYLKEKDYRPSEVKEHFNNYMKDIFDDLDLTFKYSHLDRDDNVWFTNNTGEKFEIKDLSTGEKTLLSKVMYIYFLDYKDKVILIDEPELSLHPSWQNKVLRIYEKFALKNNCQIIIATHSPHIIGSTKPEYIRLLKKEDNKIVAIDNIDRSYGLEFDKILTDIMGLEDLRTPAVAKDIKRLWELLEDEEYENEEYQTLYQKLEDILGELDKDMVLARLEVARIKSRNAKS